MKIKPLAVAGLLPFSLLLTAPAADVVIDRTQTFQTIEGWGHGGGVLGGTTGAATILSPSIADP